MSPRTKKQFEEIRESRRQQIMDAALVLFASEGYANCSIAQLAKHAGTSKGLMYNYFESKEALLVTLIEEGMHDILSDIDLNHDGVLSPEEMEAMIRKTFGAIRENQSFWTLYISIILQPRVKEFLKGKPFADIMDQYGPMIMNYFVEMGFEDPALEILTFSAMFEGFGILMVYANPGFEFPAGLLLKYENRVVNMFTGKSNKIE